uniref:RNA-dependent RNA polymerase n=1 Tax=Senko virus TaxID=2707263 RepID=A0A6H0DKA0_9VIRU|nr:MAG: RNA-dependent RNA polymerase [Senko virus]
MAKPRAKPIYDTTVTSLLSKAGFVIDESPASIYDPSQLWDTLKTYCKEDFASKYVDEHYTHAIDCAYKVFGRRGEYLQPIRDQEELKDSIDLTTSAGVYFTSKEEAWERAWERKAKVLNGEVRPYPCLALARTQRNNKTRLVWGYPLEMVMIESQYGRPLIETFKRIRSPIPYALKRCDLGARLAWSMTERNRVALDFSKFDTCVPRKLISTAFNILRTWFKDVDDSEWSLIVKYFIYTPIVMPNGELYSGKRKGVPSGSVFTQLVDSIANFIIITAAIHKFDLKYNDRTLHVLGDDSVFSTNQDVNLRAMKAYFEKLGFQLNIKKSAVTGQRQTFHFLGFDWRNGLPEKDKDAMVLSATQPERWRNRSDSAYLEQQRAKDVIYGICTLGVNLWDAYLTVFPTMHVYELNRYFERREWKLAGTSGFLDYHEKVVGNPRWSNVTTLVMR